MMEDEAPGVTLDVSVPRSAGGGVDGFDAQIRVLGRNIGQGHAGEVYPGLGGRLR
jgi:hypothetical protein